MADQSSEERTTTSANFSVDEARNQLHAFLENNKTSSIDDLHVPGGDTVPRIIQPWGDKSLSIVFRKNVLSLVAALNAVYLPMRLSGIYHSDLRALEITFTAFSLSRDLEDVGIRQFDFSYKGTVHKCEFATSSDRLLIIAANTIPLTTSLTSFRNLQSYIIYGSIKKEERSQFNLNNPLSFWISNVEWDDEGTIELISSLNFYMSYYDSKTPLVLVHNITEAGSLIKEKGRYVNGVFPPHITGTSLDQNLISFWNAAHDSNPLLAFILYYRIIEYSQFHYMDQKTKGIIKRVLSAPNLTSNIQGAVEKISETIQMKGLEEIQKFRMTVMENVDPDLIWKQIEINREYFETKTQFEGGFKVEPLINKKDDNEKFGTNGLERFINSIRKIRNTLSHGKDQETAGVIVPTAHNLQMLVPLVNIISIAAGEIILHRNNF